jgi:raffinose/stachyose/melibiose transport system permease protein
MTEASIAIRQAAGAAAHEPSGRRPGALSSVALFATLVVLAGIVLVPLIATAVGGFKSLGDLESHPFSLPSVWVWKNYWDILTGARYWQVLGNSLLISLATAIPPLFLKIRDLGLLDTYLGVILPQVAFSLAIGVLLLRSAFRQLPSELLDAAMMDGCGYFRYFFYITLPLSGPILSTVAIISFVDSWNAYLLPLIVLNSESRYPWTLGLMAYQGQYSTYWQLVLAFITLTILPAILMFLLCQRWIVAGLTAGAVKS